MKRIDTGLQGASTIPFGSLELKSNGEGNDMKEMIKIYIGIVIITVLIGYPVFVIDSGSFSLHRFFFEEGGDEFSLAGFLLIIFAAMGVFHWLNEWEKKRRQTDSHTFCYKHDYCPRSVDERPGKKCMYCWRAYASYLESCLKAHKQDSFD